MSFALIGRMIQSAISLDTIVKGATTCKVRLVTAISSLKCSRSPFGSQ